MDKNDENHPRTQNNCVITVRQKILLHLMRFSIIGLDSSSPYDLTQDGIGAVVGKNRAHISIEMRKLWESGFVRCIKTHILGCSTRRNAYMLTQKGFMEARQISEALKAHGIDPEMLLDMKRCNPSDMWNSMSEEDRDTVGKACVLRVRIPRKDLPRTAVATIPVDAKGRISIPRAVGRNYITFAEPCRIRSWHSWAADYWKNRDTYDECLYHLIKSNRMMDAGNLIDSHWDEFAARKDVDLLRLLKKMCPESNHTVLIYTLMTNVAINMGSYDEAVRASDRLSAISPKDFMELRSEILRAFGRHESASEQAVATYKEYPGVRAAATASLSFSDRGDVESAERYARLAVEEIDRTGDAEYLDLVLAARARVAKLMGNNELAASLAEQAMRTAPAHRRERMKSTCLSCI